MELKSVSIDSSERIFLDGEELQNVTAYKLEHSADSEAPAELTVTMYVNVGQVCSESSKWNLSADKIVEAVCKRLKEELQAADQSMSQDDVKTYRGIADQKGAWWKGVREMNITDKGLEEIEKAADRHHNFVALLICQVLREVREIKKVD